MRPYPVYVPLGRLRSQIDRGSGIVGSPWEGRDGQILIDFEGNRYRSMNLRTFADRVRHAWHRHTTSYQTVARLVIGEEQLQQIGWWQPDDREVDLLNPDAAVLLADWLGVDELDDAELRCS